MKTRPFFMRSEATVLTRALAAMLSLVMALGVGLTPLPAMAQNGSVLATPVAPMELPVVVEIERGPGSLKQAPLWKELFQMLRTPTVVPFTGSKDFTTPLVPAVPVPTNVVRRP